ncbi:hypothetical protein VTK73DRAFT_7788 [Phialemonium thermophilum]|uniref:C2H2-type domain-containing protein n=1 Tax=Phialemonium thermophilum TaxID=223376 RepID=A0ABR3WCV7_9PEZI
MEVRYGIQGKAYLHKFFTCDEPGCGKSYTRREHLTRHKLNHNATSTFACDQCARQFVRRDLLVRHQSRHTVRLSKTRRGSSDTLRPDESQTTLLNSTGTTGSGVEIPSPDCERDMVQSQWFSGDSLGATTSETHPPETGPRYRDQPSPASIVPGDSGPFSSGESFPLFGEQTFFGSTNDISTTADLAQWLFAEPNVAYDENLSTPASNLPAVNDDVYPRHAAVKISNAKLLDMLSIVPHHLRSSPLFKPQNLSNALASYWNCFHSHYPVLHHATFEADGSPSVLLWAMIAIGSFYTPGHDSESCHGAEALHATMTSVMDSLRWVIFGHPNFGPPAALWLLQSLILLEVFEKFCSTRQMHERGHIFHASTITLMRRGSSLGPILLQQDKGYDEYRNELERAWHTFIAKESAKRCAFLAFIIDTNSAMMFGHVQHMNPYEIRWPVPCSERLWTASSAQQWSEYAASEPKPDVELDFLSKLKEMLLVPATSTDLRTAKLGNRLKSKSPFTKIILLHGLVSVSNQLWQKQGSGLVTETSNMDGGGLPGEMRGPASSVSSKYDSTDPFPATSRTFDYVKPIVKALGAWLSYSTEESSSQSDELIAHYSLMYHYTMMSFNSDIIDLQIFAGSKRCLGRPVSDVDSHRISQRVKSWAQSEPAAEAVHHAVQIGRIYLGKKRVSGADKSLLHIWFLFHASLVCWAYGHVRQGVPSISGIEDRWQSTQDYLDRMNVAVQAIPFVRDLGETRGLIEVVIRDFLYRSRWQLIYETAPLLSNCISRGYLKTDAE